MKKRNKSRRFTIPNLFLILIINFLLAGCGKSKDETAVTPPPVTPPVTDTTTIGDTTTTNPAATDTAISLNWGDGVNLQPSYYNGGNVNFGWPLMKQKSKIKIVRIEIEPTISIALAKSWIHQADSSGYKVIATYHKYTVLGSDSVNDLLAAANWWKTNYSVLSESDSFTINLMNEWGDHNISSNDYATDYNQAISIVRQVYNGPIIIDCPGWGQETTTAAAAIKGTNGVQISDTNIVVSVHIYPNGWNQAKNHSLQNADLDDLALAGRPCIVGEFGSLPAGSADWNGMVAHAKSKGWPVLGWSWNGDGGDMNMVTPSWTNNASATSFSTSAYFDVIYDLL